MESFSVTRILLLPIVFLLVVENVCRGDVRIGDCLESDRRALIDLKRGLNNPEKWLSTWQGENCCQWRGITCNNLTGAVIAVDLHNPYNEDDIAEIPSLGGEIRPSLTKLRSLIHLDLSFNRFDSPIPPFLASLENLQYLNLSNAGFSGKIPPNLGNLTSLEYLDVSTTYTDLNADKLDWVSGLTSLKHLELNGVNLSKVGPDWLGQLTKLPYLSELHLSSCHLQTLDSSITSSNFTSLAILDLSNNSFHSQIPSWLLNISNLESLSLSSSFLNGQIPLGFSELPNLRFLDLGINQNLTGDCSQLLKGSWKKIEFLDFTWNKLHGELPASIGNMTLLRYLNLSSNNIEGGIPASIGKLCNLIHFDMFSNNLTRSLPEFLEGAEDCISNSPLPSLRYLSLCENQMVGNLPRWLGELENLVELDLGSNLFQGPIPASLWSLVRLSYLSLGGNRLNGTLPDRFGQLSELLYFDVSSNNLMGNISELHFSKLSKLKHLYLSGNSFVFNVSSNWIPKFQTYSLYLGSCYLGPLLPPWLKYQKKIFELDLSNASIQGPIPDWFWENTGYVTFLNLSFNKIQGQLPIHLREGLFEFLDLSNNLLQGSIPLSWPIGINTLLLSNNQISGQIPDTIGSSCQKMTYLSLSGNQLYGPIPDSVGAMRSIRVIDFSQNKFNGMIPVSIGNCSTLQALDLQNNSLSGKIPKSLGYLNDLRTLHLRDNNISGKIPSSFKNLRYLETLDLGNNSLSGRIPFWLGDSFPKLRILSLRLNRFSGELPSTLANLRSLQVLDLAGNKLNSRIPSSFGELKAMAQDLKTNYNLIYGNDSCVYYQETFDVMAKGQSLTYSKYLSLIAVIDLSANKLHGELPEEITKLEGLMVLNLSGNHLSGQIPQSISRFSQLLSLDLSNNFFSGPIPSSICSLDFLGYLNLSNNNLSGKIPYTGHMTTFEASSFEGNPSLCGAPLMQCQAPDNPDEKGTINGDNYKWLYSSALWGFAIGVMFPYVVLEMRRPWIGAYFALVDDTVDFLSKLGHQMVESYKRLCNQH